MMATCFPRLLIRERKVRFPVHPQQAGLWESLQVADLDEFWECNLLLQKLEVKGLPWTSPKEPTGNRTTCCNMAGPFN